MDRSGSFLPPYMSTRTTGLCLAALFLIAAGLSSISAGFEISEIRLLSVLLDEQTIAWNDRWAHGVLRTALAAARATLLVATVPVFLIWLYSARVNVRSFGSRRFRYSRKWTYLGFLIPGANLVIPFQVISEVWQASDSRGIATPVAWKAIRVPGFVRWWWGLLLGSLALELIAAALVTSVGADLGRIRLARGMSALSDVGVAASAVLAYLLVTGISNGQDRKWAVLCGDRVPHAPIPDAIPSLGEPVTAGFP